MSSTDRCFACDRKLLSRRYKADTRDDQIVDVGPDCYKLVKATGEQGYQPPLGGPRLWTTTPPPPQLREG